GPAPRRIGRDRLRAGPRDGGAPRVARPAVEAPDRAGKRGRRPPGEPVAAPPRRVFILDDHTVVRAGVRLLLDDEVDLLVVGESSSIAEFVAQPVAYDVV